MSFSNVDMLKTYLECLKKNAVIASQKYVEALDIPRENMPEKSLSVSQNLCVKRK